MIGLCKHDKGTRDQKNREAGKELPQVKTIRPLEFLARRDQKTVDEAAPAGNPIGHPSECTITQGRLKCNCCTDALALRQRVATCSYYAACEPAPLRPPRSWCLSFLAHCAQGNFRCAVVALLNFASVFAGRLGRVQPTDALATWRRRHPFDRDRHPQAHQEARPRLVVASPATLISGKWW